MTDLGFRPRPRPTAAALCALALLLALLAYSNALDNPFVYDDHIVVVENPSIARIGDLRAVLLHDIKRPLVNLSYAVDHTVWGLAPFGYHLTSLLLHLVNVGLLFAFVRRAAIDHDARSPYRAHRDRAAIVAFTAAALLAVHPLMTQAVGYIAARADLLCATFLLAALLCYRASVVTGHLRWLVATFVGWCLAVGAKESAIMLPLLLAFYDRLVLREHGAHWRRRLARIHLPFIAVSTVAGLLRLGVLLGIEYGGDGLHWTHALVEADVLRQYLSLLVMPVNQSVFHPVTAVTSLRDPHGVFAVIWVAALIVVSVRAGLHDRLALVGLAWFILLLVPPAMLVMLDLGEPMAEHRVYLASMGAFIAPGCAFGSLWRLAGERHVAWRGALAATMMVVLVGLSVLTVQRNRIWGDPVRLWNEAVAHAPDIWVTHLMLGQELEFQGRQSEALLAYREAIALRPQEPFAYVKAGACLITMGRLDEARAMFDRLRALQPRSTRPLIGLGVVASLAGRHDEARRFFLEAVDLDPGDQAARDALAHLDAEVAARALEACASLDGAARDECVARANSRQDVR